MINRTTMYTIYRVTRKIVGGSGVMLLEIGIVATDLVKSTS